jgi:uncharacterized integral membrane protein
MDDGAKQGRDMKATGKLVGLGLLGVVLIVFMAVNSDKAEVDLVFTTFEAPLFVVIIATALVSGGIGFLLAKVVDRRGRHR